MNLQLTILSILRNAAPHLLPKQTLVAEVRLRDSKPPLAEIDAALRELEDAAHALGVRNPDAPGGSRWRITDAGTLRLAEAGI